MIIASYAIFSAALAVTYIFIIRFYLKHWQRLPIWEVAASFEPSTSISILIPARNEEANITACLDAIFQQSYPSHLLQVIVIDDHSEDQTAAIAESKGAKVLALAELLNDQKIQSFKKKAIEIGVQHATGTLIVTTDADCFAAPNWLRSLASVYETKQPKFIAAPVVFYNEQNALERFQSLDFMGMMLVTGAGIQSRFMHLCNGANLAYPKEVFRAVDGFEGVDHLASGDDLFLMQKVAKSYPGELVFLKSQAACVQTFAKPDWRSFLQQRLRWGTKSSSYQEIQVTAVLALVFFLCWNILLSLALGLVWNTQFLWVFLFQLVLKAGADFVFLSRAADFFHRRDLMRYFAYAQWYHIAYIIVVGSLSNLTKTYEWKGRKVR